MRAWVDASAGIAGDMLLGALIDAGAAPAAVRSAVDAVLPGAVSITTSEVRRAGLRACLASVTPLVADPPHRTWRDIRELPLPPRAAAVFARLAEAEGTVHGIAPEDVHFHEVGALDAIADVVGVCAALDDLGVTTLTGGEVAVGSGTVRTAHGELPVPAPAVAALARGWRVRAGGTGELATPTGMALLRTLAATCEDMPSLLVGAVGVGAGSRDTPGRPNVVRVFLGSPATRTEPEAVLLEANVDDLDPRLWPGVLRDLLAAGADDAWLVPILMKKGRPAHTVSALCSPAAADRVRDTIFRTTSTLGVRASARVKTPLDRTFARLTVDGCPIAVKLGHRDGVILQAMPEFADVAALAATLGITEREALHRATTAATNAGLLPGAPSPMR